MLTETDLKRYIRQMPVKDWGEAGQEKLKKARVFVAGAGGLGGPVIMSLAGAGVGTICICDYDTVELSNLNRQILHAQDRIGMNKTESALKTVSGFNPDIKLIPVHERITEKNCAELVSGFDLIMDCLDSFEARMALAEGSVKKSIPVVHGAVEGFHGQAAFLQPPETPCPACFLPGKDSGKTPSASAASVFMTGSIQAMEALKFLLGKEPALKGKLLFFDGLDMTFSTVRVPSDTDCPVCGHLHKLNNC